MSKTEIGIKYQFGFISKYNIGSEKLIMLRKSNETTIAFCISIMIIFTLYSIVVLINFFTKDNVTKESIVGINPINATKTIMAYEEPLTVVLEDQKKVSVLQKKETKETLQSIPPVKSNQNTKEKVQEDIKVETRIVSQNQIDTKSKEKAIETKTQPQPKTQKEVEIKTVEQPRETQNSVLTNYKGFATVGKIEIPKTGVNIPILNQVTVEGMKNAPCLLYSTGELNQNGNNLIVGHNFRNGTIFSNNKNLKLGDKIYVTTLDGNKVEYTIYDKFITTAEDVSYLTRDTNNLPEITLSCCTDDDEYRIIILARI